jgi:para-nitrobenzyl esterase
MRVSAFTQSTLLIVSALWSTSTATATLDTDQLLVKTSSGILVGRYNATSVRAFLGVRYAFPPIGARRFAAPVPFDVSPDMRDATSFGSTCPGQYYPGTTIYTILPYLPFSQQNEDCLNLNVWAPSAERTKASGNKLPVMVFIPGGKDPSFSPIRISLTGFV